jgi:hypothetical protein
MDERPTGPVERSEDIPAATDVEVPISGGLRGTLRHRRPSGPRHSLVIAPPVGDFAATITGLGRQKIFTGL